MILNPFLFKMQARKALKGNWQTALLVAFFASIFMTIAQVAGQIILREPMEYAKLGMSEGMMQAIDRIPDASILLMSALQLLAFVITPMLTLGCNHYFVSRMQGVDLGVSALWSRLRVFGRALWLSIVMSVRIFLWSLLLFVPGIIAAIRYSMAPYYLAEDPTMTASEAIQKSKNAMKNMKMNYFSLLLSFVGWLLIATLLQELIAPISAVVGLVVGLFLNLFITTYQYGAVAAFFLAVSSPEAMARMQAETKAQFKQLGVDPAAFDDLPDEPFSEDDGTPDRNADDDDEGDDDK